MILAETYIDPYMEPTWLEYVGWHVFGDPVVEIAFITFTLVWLLGSIVDQYLTAFHRKSGNRIMYDGEPEEYRWRWPPGL